MNDIKQTISTQAKTQVQPKINLWKKMRKNALLLSCFLAIGMLGANMLSGSPVLASGLASTIHGSGGFSSFQHGRGHTAAMQKHVEQQLTAIGANDTQKKDINALLKQASLDQAQDFQQMHLLAMQLKTVLSATAINEIELASLRDKQDQLMLATSHRISDTIAAVARILTPQQREQINVRLESLFGGKGSHHRTS